MTRLCILIVAILSLGAPVPAMAQSSEPIVLLVNPKSGVKSVAEFAAWAKRTKKPLAYSSSGPASQRVGEALAQKLEFKTVHIPYRAAQQGILDLIGGHIDFAVVDVGAATGQIQGGLVLALAVAAKQRTPGFPDVPTFAEAGYPDLAAVFPASTTTVSMIMSPRPAHSTWLSPAHARH
jgi:tripartite-type tricarboxylate transporter receptor subunit TctC